MVDFLLLEVGQWGDGGRGGSREGCSQTIVEPQDSGPGDSGCVKGNLCCRGEEGGQ